MTTNSERWQRIEALFDSVSELPEDQREAWLDEACGDDPSLKSEVLELLRFDGDATGGVRASLKAAASDAAAKASSAFIGSRIGAYRVREKIADGGMGSVFLADRADGSFEQTVAIKLLPRHLAGEETTSRFVEERKILASLEHPNIARLIDGGMLDDGVPYIAMEYVDGVTIDKYCHDNKIGYPEIIKLIMRVCDAVRFAHRKLIIHRDIKPGNILVDREGVPKLLDFGIAKLVDSESNADRPLTQEDRRVLTPLYASPEQIEGLPVTTAVDVYGLGLLLYRLLTGRLPYVPTSGKPQDIEQAILSAPATLPSVAASNTISSQKRALRGDLDTILLMALRKEPERRYESVAAFAEDLGRYLKKLPIQARKDSFAYKLGKFAQRHRLPLGVATVFVAVAIGLTAYYTRQLAVERDTAEQTATFLSDLFEASDPYQRNRDGLTVSTLLESGLEKLEGDTELSPLVRARLLTTVALVQNNLGDVERADVLATEALELAETHAGMRHELTIPPLSVLSRIKNRAGDYAAAKALAERMLDVSDATHGRESAEAAQATHLLSIQAYREGDLETMGTWAEETYAIRKAIYADGDMAVAAGATALGLYHWRSGNLEKARNYYAESARIQDMQAERNDLQYAGLLHNLALLHNDTGDYATAVATYEKSVAIRREAGSEHDPVLPLTLYGLAHSLSRLGNLPASHRTFIDTVRRQADVAGAEQHMVAFALNGYGFLLEEMGELEDAGRLLTEANRIFGAVFDEPHMDQAATWIGLARLAAHAGEYDRGRLLIDRAIALRTKAEGEDDHSTLRAHNALGRLEYARGDFAAAAAALEHALDAYERVGAGEHPFALESKTWLGRTRLALGDAEAATIMLREARDLGESLLPATHFENVQRRLWLGEALAANGDRTEGDPMIMAARDELQRIWQSWQAALEAEPVPSLATLLDDSEV